MDFRPPSRHPPRAGEVSLPQRPDHPRLPARARRGAPRRLRRLPRGDAMLERALDAAPPARAGEGLVGEPHRPQSRETARRRRPGPSPDDRLRAAEGGGGTACRQTWRGRHAQPADRRGARDGQRAELRPERHRQRREVAGDLERRQGRKPLLNRALDEYYLPGSTLKTLTAAAGIESRLDDKTFTCQGAGWTPPGSNRPIRDDEGEAARLDRAARRLHAFLQSVLRATRRRGRAPADGAKRPRVSASASSRPGRPRSAWARSRNLWNTEQQSALRRASRRSARPSSRAAGSRKYDLALESIGQGYVQLTPDADGDDRGGGRQSRRGGHAPHDRNGTAARRAQPGDVAQTAARRCAS